MENENKLVFRIDPVTDGKTWKIRAKIYGTSFDYISEETFATEQECQQECIKRCPVIMKGLEERGIKFGKEIGASVN